MRGGRSRPRDDNRRWHKRQSPTIPGLTVGIWYRGWCAQRAQSPSRFPGGIFDQKGREAVGHGHRNKAGAAGQPARRARNVRVPDPIRFVIFEDNGDAYRWTLVVGDAADPRTVAR